MGRKEEDRTVHARICFDHIFDLVKLSIKHSHSAVSARLSLMAAAEYIAAEFPTLDSSGTPVSEKPLRKAAKNIQGLLREQLNERRDSTGKAIGVEGLMRELFPDAFHETPDKKKLN